MGRMPLPSPLRRARRGPHSALALVVLMASGACKQRITGTSAGAMPTMSAPMGAAPTALPLSTPVVASASTAPRPNANLTTYGVLKTPPSAYVNPMLTGRETSSWCFCRNIGTSPHIGWDLGFSLNRSIALSNGVVKSKRNIGGGCGWEIVFEDTGGALWRYLHLNTPTLAAGTVVFQGALMGVHEQYPSSSCGSGPHLHLERHSAGPFGDKEQKKVCDAGYAESCRYDAKTPFAGKRVLSSTSEAASLQEKNKSETEKAKQGYAAGSDAGGPELVELDTTAYECAFGQPEPAPVEAPPPDAPDPDGSALRVAVGETPRGSLRSLATLALSAGGDPDGSNACARGACVTAWTLFARTDTGWRLALSEEGTREAPARFDADGLLCYPRGFTGEWFLEATLEEEGTTRRVTARGRTR